MAQLVFDLFKAIHRILRGTGLGRIRLLRSMRDGLYNVLRPKTPRIIEVNGYKMWVDPSTEGGVVPWLMLDEVHEPAETSCIMTGVRSGGGFIDIGANIGYYSLLAAKLAGPGGIVYAFEPEPVNFETLKRNIELNEIDTIIAEPIACSDREGVMRLHLDAANAGGHYLGGAGEGGQTREIRAVTLDRYFAGNRRSIDLIKMDIQGHEPKALRGMREFFSLHPETGLLTEFDPVMLRRESEDPEQFLRDLRNLGFRITILGEPDRRLDDAGDAEVLSRCSGGDFVNLYCHR